MIKVLSLFSGIGAFEKALENLNIDFEIVNYCEIDKYASKAYSLIHNIPESKNLGDITKINEKDLPKDIDLITYGFPCQDISISGTKKGFIDEQGNKTRSGLFFDALRILECAKPKIAIAENVKNITSKKMMPIFNLVLNSLSEAGYVNQYKIMDACDYGMPQSRKRIFIVSFRKDIYHGFNFPEPVELTTWMRDYLEKDAPIKYDLSEKAIQYMDEKVSDGRTHWEFNYHNDTDKKLSRCILANIRKGIPYNVLIERNNSVCRPEAL